MCVTNNTDSLKGMIMKKLIILLIALFFSNTNEYQISYLEPEPYDIESIQIEEKDIYEQISEEYLTMMDELKTTNNKELWFVEYKELIDKYSEYAGMPETIYECYDENDIKMIQKVVETECYDQDFESKVNVACVIINRIESGDYGESIYKVITSPNQFAFGRNNISETTILAVEYAFSIEDTTNGCIGFRSDKNPNTWNGWEYVFTDSIGHHFYKEKEKE